MRILEEFWYGNIEPTEYDTFPCAEYKEALQRISRNEEKLQATMTDAQKELLRQGRYVVPIIFDLIFVFSHLCKKVAELDTI